MRRVCGREGCGVEFDTMGGRRLYCSIECLNDVYRAKARAQSNARNDAARESKARKYVKKMCLACGVEFNSEGPWNRICGSCSASEYRRGAASRMVHDPRVVREDQQDARQ